MQRGNDRQYLEPSKKEDESDSILQLNSNLEPNLRSINLNSIAQPYSNSLISIIQTVSESDDINMDTLRTHSINNPNALSSPLKLPPEPTSNRVAWMASSDIPSIIGTVPTISSNPPADSTPYSGFTALSNSSINPYGTRIGKNHSSFLLMYFMLTGIRSAVEKLEENQRPIPITYEQLTKGNFKENIKFSLNKKKIYSKCCFKSSKTQTLFKDYAPVAFKLLRKCFFIDSTDYLVILN